MGHVHYQSLNDRFRRLLQSRAQINMKKPDDLAVQLREAMLAMAVTNLGRWESLVPVLRELGGRHLRYGVKPVHYETVGAALLATLEKGLGKEIYASGARGLGGLLHLDREGDDGRNRTQGGAYVTTPRRVHSCR